ncbi:uncharacterized protein G2W53_012877 [Senna tora]|uniref:Uncharacterized protein n=1 Tax=Senna tora TaxID=362788 RepID=A0A834TYV1_9FABA|nr:uncharacterized protein G2W53_012877 [Senna tora]
MDIDHRELFHLHNDKQNKWCHFLSHYYLPCPSNSFSVNWTFWLQEFVRLPSGNPSMIFHLPESAPGNTTCLSISQDTAVRGFRNTDSEAIDSFPFLPIRACLSLLTPTELETRINDGIDIDFGIRRNWFVTGGNTFAAPGSSLVHAGFAGQSERVVIFAIRLHQLQKPKAPSPGKGFFPLLLVQQAINRRAEKNQAKTECNNRGAHRRMKIERRNLDRGTALQLMSPPLHPPASHAA